MKTLKEIQAAIEKLPPSKVAELADWIAVVQTRRSRPTPEQVEAWLKRSRGVAKPGVTTESILGLTRGEG